LNAFVLFGLPGEDLPAFMNTAIYASHRVGSAVPMLFTPVPGSRRYDEHKTNLTEEMGWNLPHLNGKWLPFLEYNRRRYPNRRASDYVEMEAFVMHLNDSKVYERRFDVAGAGRVGEACRACLTRTEDAVGQPSSVGYRPTKGTGDRVRT
jgi:radical SAM superfamily enzyme YgiQ (UPF0313 family)